MATSVWDFFDFIFIMRRNVDACGLLAGSRANTVRESALKVDSGREREKTTKTLSRRGIEPELALRPAFRSGALPAKLSRLSVMD